MNNNMSTAHMNNTMNNNMSTAHMNNNMSTNAHECTRACKCATRPYMLVNGNGQRVGMHMCYAALCTCEWRWATRMYVHVNVNRATCRNALMLRGPM